jgi:hypothetical protein
VNERVESCCPKTRTVITVAVIIATFLIMGGLVKLMIAYTSAPSTSAARALERQKFRDDLRAEVANLTNSYAKLDAAKGVIRLPIQRAMELMVQEWRQPAAARSNLIERVEKATALPPKAPEKPSIYE